MYSNFNILVSKRSPLIKVKYYNKFYDNLIELKQFQRYVVHIF